MSILAACPDCQKSFRVPHANKIWSCKSCGAQLELIPDVPCPACQAPSDPTGIRRAECGEKLRENETKEARRARVHGFGDGAGEQSIAQREARRARARSNRTSLRLAGILTAIVAVLALGFFAWKVSSRPSNPDATLEAFLIAWNAEDVPTVGSFFGADRAEKWTGNIHTLQEKYEWGTDLPPFDGFRITDRGETVLLVDFTGSGGALGTRFRWRDSAWVVTRFDMRGVKNWRP